ncbi:MAG TPA: winged helix DNA-binding domain-containing protein [Methylomirabilota bacterium]|nr:winged helix DNA-binding domain-containing protein [Methylomirabilota bacterium]
MTSRTAHPVLTRRQLNRATLARQLLLERADLDIVTATERIGGLQAQEPASPYIGLWTRMAEFKAADLDRAIAERAVVKGTLMRSTLHLVSAADYLHFWPAVFAMIEGIRRQDRVQPPSVDQLALLTARAESFTAEPRALSELRDHLGQSDGLTPDEVVWWIRRRVAFAHAPSEVSWSFGRRPRLAHALAWLGADTWPASDLAVERLVRRYLGAFGPATAADLGQWSGVAVGKLRPGIAAVEATGDLRRFTDERGRELLDLEGSPLPDADTPAPPRLLAMWDSPLLAFADRTRLISDDDRRVVIARNGDTLPTFTVDGAVAGLWWAEAAPGGRPRIVIEPFRPPLRRAEARALEEEAERLADFVSPIEPAVYSRYQRWRQTARS